MSEAKAVTQIGMIILVEYNAAVPHNRIDTHFRRSCRGQWKLFRSDTDCWTTRKSHDSGVTRISLLIISTPLSGATPSGWLLLSILDDNRLGTSAHDTRTHKDAQRRLSLTFLPFHDCFLRVRVNIVAFKHVGQNQMKCTLLNERPCDTSLVQLWPNLSCLPDREWRVSLLFTLFRSETWL